MPVQGSTTHEVPAGHGASTPWAAGARQAAFAFAQLATAQGRPARIMCQVSPPRREAGLRSPIDADILLGLAGLLHGNQDDEASDVLLRRVRQERWLPLGGGCPIAFVGETDLTFEAAQEAHAPEGALRFTADYGFERRYAWVFQPCPDGPPAAPVVPRLTHPGHRQTAVRR